MRFDDPYSLSDAGMHRANGLDRSHNIAEEIAVPPAV